LRKLRLFTVAVMPMMLIMAVAGIRPAAAAPANASAAETFNALVGHEIFTEEGQKSSWQAIRFYPENITVNVGDSISWKFDAGVEPHTVSFLSDSKLPDFVTPECNGAPCPPPPPGGGGGPPPPGVTIKLRVSPIIAFPQGGNSYDGSGIVSSGVVASDLPGPKDYSLSFTKAGTYTFVCLVHAVQLPDGTIVGMQGKVTVQAEGSAYPKTNAQVQAEAQAMMAADEQEARAAEPEAKTKMVTTRPGANGTTVHHVNSGYQIFKPTYAIDYMRFAPNDINISVGDTVEWSSPTPHSFHNVLFGEEPEALLVEPQPAGPPKLYFNTKIALPSGGPDYAGSDLYSAGIIVGPEDPPQAGAQGYALTFSASGRFEYICGLHYHNGMDGHVTVAARTGGGQPGMPTTGNADNWSLVAALLVALAATLVGLFLRLRLMFRRNAVK
jgi:plastocyanin